MTPVRADELCAMLPGEHRAACLFVAAICHCGSAVLLDCGHLEIKDQSRLTTAGP